MDLDHNSKIFRDTLIVLNMSLQSIAAVMDDLACGRPVAKMNVEGTEHVDYNRYLDDFRQKLNTMKQAEAPSAQSPIAPATYEEVQIFGGGP